MSEGVLVEILNLIHDKRADYRAAADFAHTKGDNSLYEYNRGAQTALEDIEDHISGYLGTGCPEEE